jgi:hypothetical protein
MKLAHLTTLIILAIPTAAQQTPPDPCVGVPPPRPVVDVVIESNAPKYTGPACLEGETCTTPADWDTREFLPDGSVRHTFTNVGELRAVSHAEGVWTSEERVMLPAPAPACWAWQWRPVP